MEVTKDNTGPAFPCEAEGFKLHLTGMTYRQWLAGQIAPQCFDIHVVKEMMNDLKQEYPELTRKEITDMTRNNLAYSVWALTDMIISLENT